MQLVQESLVIIGAHTPNAKVFWNGKEIDNIEKIVVKDGQVTLQLTEDLIISELRAAGIKIKRGEK